METPNKWNLPEKGEHRVGGPRTNWVINTSELAWKRFKLHRQTIAGATCDFDPKNKEHVKIIIEEGKETLK